MGTLELKIDSKYHLFSLDVFSQNVETVPYTAIIDTGSEISGLNERTARALGIDIDRLQKRPTAGIGGVVKDTPMIQNFSLFFLASNNYVSVTLPLVSIHRDTRTKVTKKESGMTVARGIGTTEVPNILGVDFLSQLNGKLCLDFKNSKYMIEW
jgi:hypothetical protein